MPTQSGEHMAVTIKQAITYPSRTAESAFSERHRVDMVKEVMDEKFGGRGTLNSLMSRRILPRYSAVRSNDTDDLIW